MKQRSQPTKQPTNQPRGRIQVAGRRILELFGIPIIHERIVVDLDGEVLVTRGSWNRLRRRVKDRDNSTCQYCGRIVEKGTVDHVLPLAQGGTDELDNLVWACKGCNGSKGNRTPKQWKGGQGG